MLTKQTIRIELPPKSAVGTKAIVTTNRLFRGSRTETYVCHRCNALTGGEWMHETTGAVPSEKLTLEINEAAMAAARLYKARIQSELSQCMAELG